MYTARFSELYELIDTLYGVSVNASAEANTGFVDISGYIRFVVIIHPVSLEDNLDIDIEQATSTAGTDGKSFDSGSKDTLILTTDTKPTVIEVRPEEFDMAGSFDHFNVEVIPAATGGTENYYVVEIWGEPVYKPAATTNLDAVVD